MYKFMIVDDESTVIHGLSKQVDWESKNMELIGTATNGRDALALMINHPLDLLITDVCMPQMDGMTLIQHAKKIHPDLRCIVISAHDQFEYIKQALQLGVENYLLKPINPNELNDTLNKTLKNMEQNLNNAHYTPSMISSEVLAFRTNILDRWINGNIQDFELYERGQLVHINLTDPEYLVCVIKINHAIDVDMAFSVGNALLNTAYSDLYPVYQGEFFLDNLFRVNLIFHGRSLKNILHQLQKSIHDICMGADFADMQLFCTIGPIVDNPMKLNQSYAAAAFYLNYYYLDKQKCVLACEAYPPPSSSLGRRCQALLAHFSNALKSENASYALELSTKYVEQAAKDTSSEIQIYLLPFVLTLIQTVLDAGQAATLLPSVLLEKLSQFTVKRTYTELKDWLRELTQTALKAIHERKGSFHLLVHLTLEQINKKYQEDLSLKTLAEPFGVTPAYLGQLFKSETGQLFNDYLTDIRLQTGKILLLETDLKIGEIIEQVGIPNQSYFNRLFKKQYGISPTEFRRHNSNIKA